MQVENGIAEEKLLPIDIEGNIGCYGASPIGAKAS
jgi:hypothetical protein